MLRTIPVTPEDDAFLYRLYVSTRIAEVTAWGWDEDAVHSFLRMQWGAQKSCYQTTHPDAIHRLIAYQGLLAGRILLGYGEHSTLLMDISILPEFRNQGIGAGMIRSLQSEAGEAGKTLRLHVLRRNPAKRLYERLGFTGVGGNEIYEYMAWQK